jgi:hypothetical protein
MRLTIVNLLVCGMCFLSNQLLTQTPAQTPERNRIAPASGGVEIQEIQITRRTALNAVREADITNMQLQLMFPSTWKKTGEAGFPHHLIRLHSLSSIEDDTGKLLLTEKRLKQIEYLRGEVRGNEWSGFGGKEGPVISLLLEAPERRANKIKAIRGRADVSVAKAVSLTFNDLSAINGKELDHPDMKGLKDLKLRFSIEVKEGRVSAKVKAPISYISPWNLGRLDEWAMIDAEKEIELSSEAMSSPENEGVTVERTYDRPDIKGWSLCLTVLEPVETKTFNFDFRNVQLP